MRAAVGVGRLSTLLAGVLTDARSASNIELVFEYSSEDGAAGAAGVALATADADALEAVRLGSASDDVAGVVTSSPGSTPTLDPAADVLAQVRALRARLAEAPRQMSDEQRVDAIRACEELKNAACAAQARWSVDLDASQRAVQAAAGVPAGMQGQGVAGQVALARRESAHRGARHLGLAKVLVAEMPHTRVGLGEGWLSEWRATLLARETACLSAKHRGQVDAELVDARRAEVESWGDARLVAEVRRMAYRLDPDAVLARIRKAENQRCVTSRPAPDTMAYLTALLPADKAVACYAALKRVADTARATGDPRTRGQVMADTLVELLTGKKIAEGTPVEIGLVITDRALFANMGTAGDAEPGSRGDPREEPAYLQGYGIVPAGWARNLIAGLPEQTKAWIRRLYSHPKTGQLVAMESRRRLFKHSIRRFTLIRDQTCRTPWCDAPIRHVDHPEPHAQGGRTSRRNSQGLCEACNYAKEAPGWTARAVPGLVHTVRTTTPTGHVYDSTAPPLPGQWPAADPPEESGIGDEVVPVDPLDEREHQALFEHLLEQYAA